MTRTGYRLPKWAPGELAQGYRDGKRWGTTAGRFADPGKHYWHLWANGGIHSTAADVHRWHLALEGERVLPKEAKAKLFACTWTRTARRARSTPTGGPSPRPGGRPGWSGTTAGT